MKARDQKAQDAVSGAFGVSYAVAFDGQILAMSGAHRHGSDQRGDRDSGLTFVDRDLFSIIQGEAVREAYRTIHESVISSQQPVTFEYRCDAPDMARRMSMTISPFQTSDGAIAALYHSQAVEVRRRLPLPYLDWMRQRSDPDLPMVRVCAWCAQVNAGDGWRKPDQYYADGGAADVTLTHGICPACADKVIAPLLAKPKPRRGA